MSDDTTLSASQKAIAPIAAFAAAGEMPRLDRALRQGLDAGLGINETKEILIQLYAYAGFPRSLNALGQLMRTLDARRADGIEDKLGNDSVATVPSGAALLAAGTANQTRLAGAPVAGPLFDFAPAIDVFLKTHLFGAIFERDNLDWPSRELATVSMLSALPGAESQLASHIGISLNVGLSTMQLRTLATALKQADFAAAAARIDQALDQRAA